LALIVLHDCPKHAAILSDGGAFFPTSHRICGTQHRSFVDHHVRTGG
jgi:hypothetical protein